MRSPRLTLNGSVGIEVHEQHADLVAVAGVDEARRVQARHAVPQRQTRARLHEARVARRDRDRDARGHERATRRAVRAPRSSAGVEVESRVAGVLRRRERQPGIDSADRNAQGRHGADAR